VEDLFSEARKEADFADHDLRKSTETKNTLINNLAYDLLWMRSHKVTKALLEAIITITETNQEEQLAAMTWLFAQSVVHYISSDYGRVPSSDEFSHVKSIIETFMSGKQKNYDLLARVLNYLRTSTRVTSVIFNFYGQTKTLQFRYIREEYIKLLKELVPEVSKPIESESDPLRNLKEEIQDENTRWL
jgi:hypothetical protein